MAKATQYKLSKERNQEILSILKTRFEKNMNRHKGIDWNNVLERLTSQSKKLWTINKMEETGGEPDVIGIDEQSNEFIFCDCSAETPKGRRSLCYDQESLDTRKEHKPRHSAVGLAKEMGLQILDEEKYKMLQALLGSCDNKTSSWLLTPKEQRDLGGAIFGDHRFGRVFIYHNGAESYYGSRGFRGMMKV